MRGRVAEEGKRCNEISKATRALKISPMDAPQLAGLGEVFSGSGGVRIKLQDAMKLGEFEAGFDHTFTASETQMAAGSFQAGEATDNRTDGGAVDVSDFAEIEDDKVFLALNEGFGFLLEATAIRAALDTALHLKEGNAVFGGRFYHVENHEFALPFREK